MPVRCVMNTTAARSFSAFDSEGTRNFANVTKRYKGRQLAVVLDGKLYTAPTIQTEILAGSGEITGQFSDEEVNNIANALVSGSFPFMIRVDSIYDAWASPATGPCRC